MLLAFLHFLGTPRYRSLSGLAWPRNTILLPTCSHSFTICLAMRPFCPFVLSFPLSLVLVARILHLAQFLKSWMAWDILPARKTSGQTDSDSVIVSSITKFKRIHNTLGKKTIELQTKTHC